MRTPLHLHHAVIRTLQLNCSVLSISVLLLTSQAFGQQSYVGRFDAFAGYTYLNSPKINLAEPGFHGQFGVRAKTWLSLGFDYSLANGDLNLEPNMLLTSLQQKLGAQLAQLAAAGRLPAGYVLKVPASSRTQTFAAGPQVALHHWRPVTLFLRPSAGLIKETATPHPGDPIATGIVQQLAPSGKKQNTVKFYGFGGGFDLNVAKHFALRLQADFVHDYLFNDLLSSGRNTVRFSIGPAFQWGKNVAER